MCILRRQTQKWFCLLGLCAAGSDVCAVVLKWPPLFLQYLLRLAITCIAEAVFPDLERKDLKLMMEKYFRKWVLECHPDGKAKVQCNQSMKGEGIHVIHN